ncbi:hypothetical protein [Natronoarchaeum rubrum]|uniref:hypothetical protein n=1 Tax=Natronoarchaeum rubrum TaxID=755311 RepID=UPI00211319DD|nr:hypothetical protein [Natronoarchaeum rubrum]
MSDGDIEQEAIVRTCPGCGSEMDVSDGPYIYIGYHLRPDAGGFCCSAACAHDVIDDRSMEPGGDQS